MKERLAGLEYLRGLAMMGVLGIHVGSQYLLNPAANVHLIALFEIASRFSVPIFFFISALGLFYNLDPRKPFSYGDFLRRRAKTVLVPYLAWSFFYIVHDSWHYHAPFDIAALPEVLFFGLAKYQLYFMVLLLWFYALMPLWIWLVRRLTPLRLGFLLALQVAVCYYFCYDAAFLSYVYSLPPTDPLQPFLIFRLNYWVINYFFIWLLGGYLAVHLTEFRRMGREKVVTVGFLLSLAALLGYYYHLLACGLTAEGAVNTAHQLSPPGILYTFFAALFFFRLFDRGGKNSLLALLGKHSYFIYLFHPFALGYLAEALTASGCIMTAPLAIAFYFAVLSLSLGAAVIFRRLGGIIPPINALTIGLYKR